MHRPLASILLLLATTALLAGCGSGSTPDLNAGPSVSSVVPASGGVAGGTPLVIQGTGLRNPQAGTYQVLVGNQPATDIHVVSDTEVQCKAPPNAAGPAAVTVVTIEGEGTVPGAFTYYPGPTITSITPDNGTRFGNVAVTLVGTGFANNDPGVTLPLIDLKALVDPVVVDDTTITGLTPTSWLETAKDVTVQNRNGKATLPGGFVYTGPLPLIYSLTPTDGPRGGGTPVTITGDWFTVAAGALTVRFGTVSTFGIRVDDQHLTCITPPSPVPGLVDVAVSNGNGESALPDAFYFVPAPALTLVTPNEGSSGGGEEVTIIGQDFTAAGAGTTTVTFDGNPASNLAIVNDTTITCDTPPGAVGTVDVTIVNGNGTDTLTAAYTYVVACWWETPFGTPQSHSDDSSISASMGITFPFYGGNITSIYINSNGSLTTGPWTTWSASSQSTYNEIAAGHRDLYPPSGGTIYYKTLPDRFVVTYDNIPPLGGTGVCLWQIHLIDNGTICILYNGTTVSTPLWAGVQPGLGGTVSTTANLSDGPNTSTVSTALTENFGTFDLDGGFLEFTPDGSGGYVQNYYGFIP